VLSSRASGAKIRHPGAASHIREVEKTVDIKMALGFKIILHVFLTSWLYLVVFGWELIKTYQVWSVMKFCKWVSNLSSIFVVY